MRRKILTDGAAVFCGALLFAVSVQWFFNTAQIACGGLYGLSLALRHFFPGLPLGTAVFALNLPLFALALRRRGRRFVARNLAAVALVSVLTDAVGALVAFPPLDPLLASFYAGAVQGAAIGLLLRCGASTGGTELAATLLVRRFPHWSVGRVCLVFDLAILAFYALVSGALTPSLCGGIALFLESFAIDAIVYGGRRAKVAFLISRRGDALCRALLAQGIGVTRLNGLGAFSGEANDVLLCAVRRRKVAAVRGIVKATDSGAFCIFCDAREVSGLGFFNGENEI